MYRTGRSRELSPQHVAFNRGCGKFFFFLFLASVPILLSLLEYYRVLNFNLLETAKSRIQQVDINSKIQLFPSDVIYTTTNITSVVPVLDPDFNINFDALKVERRTEYCQWSETYTDTTTKDDQGIESTVRSYYYSKGWQSHITSSIFFDQPAAHWNPFYDPYPSQVSFSPKVTLNDNRNISVFELTRDLIQKVEPTKFHVPSNNQILDFTFSRATDFKYIGRGFFYHSHVPSTFETFLRGVGMASEGSLLDFQLADLFRICEAGDIRISYDTVSKGSLSVIGMVTNKNALDLVDIDGQKFGILFSKYDATSDYLFKREWNKWFWWIFGSRIFGLIWSVIIVTEIYRSRLGIEPRYDFRYVVSCLLDSAVFSGMIFSVIKWIFWQESSLGQFFLIFSLGFAGLRLYGSGPGASNKEKKH